jgi:hypothetical protein
MFVEVWEESDGQWRWRYLEPGGNGQQPFELPSAEDYPTSEAAIEAAEAAYPGVPIRLNERLLAAASLPAPAGRDRGARRAAVASRLGPAARRLGQIALLAVALTAVSRLRRRRRAGRDQDPA